MTLYKWSQTALADATADSTINWAEGQSPSSVNDSARAMMAATAKYRDDSAGSLVTTGTATAYLLTSNQNFDTLTHLNGQEICFQVHVANGASPTLNIDSLGAFALVTDSAGTAIPIATLTIGSVRTATFVNASSHFRLKDFTPVVTASIPAAAVTYPKIQNVAAVSLLGNPTGSSATVEEITLGSGLAFSGTALIATLSAALVPGYISGLTLSTAGSSAAFGIATGVANDSSASILMNLASSYTKTTSAWAVGSGNGALDTSTIAVSTWYHVWLIERPDTAVVDVLISLSATSPTMPTNYTIKRRIGSMEADGSGNWGAFTQNGDRFTLFVQQNITAAATSTSRTIATLPGIPTGIAVPALFRANLRTSASTNIALLSLLEADVAVPAPGTAAPGASLVGVGSGVASGHFEIITNTSAQICHRSSSVNADISFGVYGWIDTRGK